LFARAGPEREKEHCGVVLIFATTGKAALLESRKDQDLTITDLMKELSEIESSEWVDKTVGYEVQE